MIEMLRRRRTLADDCMVLLSDRRESLPDQIEVSTEHPVQASRLPAAHGVADESGGVYSIAPDDG